MIIEKKTVDITLSAPTMSDCITMLPLIQQIEVWNRAYSLLNEYSHLTEEEQKKYYRPYINCPFNKKQLDSFMFILLNMGFELYTDNIELPELQLKEQYDDE